MTSEPAPIDRSRIRVKSFVVVPDQTRTHHAVWRGEDSTKEPPSFHRVLGGSVEFGEASIDTAVREMREELGIELVEPRLLGVLENVYTFRGEPGHEILFVYTSATTTDVVPPEGGEFFDLGRSMWVEWRRLDGVGETLPLYPDGLQRLLDEDRRRVG
jgi:ADP-ribose pyrophosphatase YjhB (NUDIX family)